MKKDRITRDNIAQHLIQKELDYVGKTIEEVKSDPEWFVNNTLTEQQHQEWKDYSISLIKKTLRTNQKKAEYEFAMLDLAYGLKVLKEEK